MYSFFDTNILVYLFDTRYPDKQKRAHDLFAQETSQGIAVISTQVLQEFYTAVTSRLPEPLEKNIAQQAVIKFTQLPVRQIDTQIILSAMARNRNDQISFWDALIIETALVAGARILWSEDMQNGRDFDGLRIQDPFHT